MDMCILLNGKIIMVDDQFSIQQAVAIEGDRIKAVGQNATVRALAGPTTEVIDLHGRTVIPGLIDNHNHFIRGTDYWADAVRLDGVSTRTAVLDLLRQRASVLKTGHWLLTLGGWSEDQLEGDRRDLTLRELDEIAGDHPAFLQSKFDHAFVNTAWLKAMGVPLVVKPPRSGAGTAPAVSAPSGDELSAHVVRDAEGRATGRISGGILVLSQVTASFPAATEEDQVANVRAAQAYYHSIGLTAVFDPGGVGVSDANYARIQALADRKELTLRVFATLGDSRNGSTPADARALADRVRSSKPFEGDQWYNRIAVGEIYYVPFHWDDIAAPPHPSPEDVTAAVEILRAAAAGGWPVQTHVLTREGLDLVFDAYERVNRDHPVRALRWSVTHAEGITPEHLERARRLGVTIQVRSEGVIGNQEKAIASYGAEAVRRMPPLQLIQDSGLVWGLGTDGTKLAQINPFVTLWWAVTGKSLGGASVLDEHVTREQALIAHTRSNAWMMFQESYLGSIRPGLLADLVVLDRDYLSVPVDQIKDIRPTATLVGGKVVYGTL